MCTVTLIPKGHNDFLLTSNRDEAPNRHSLSPNIYNINGVKTLFPKDELSGGTWIGLSNKNRLVCVLNGAYVMHKRKSSYRLSRGVVVKDFMISDDIINVIIDYNLNDIEPFTLVIVDWSDALKFYELVWDGLNKHFNELPMEPKIWSSSSLYTDKMKQERKLWFDSFKSEKVINAASILNFHKSAGQGNDDYGVIMNRGFVKTTSITQVKKNGNSISMCYENLQNDINTVTTFPISQVIND